MIVVTGANRGIGLGFAKMCAREGAHLVLILRKNNSSIISELTSLGALSVAVYEADLSKREDIKSVLKKLQKLEIDILFNNAGLLTGGLIEEQPTEDIYQMFQVNVLSLIELTQALVPQMIKRGQGKIINNSSVSAYMHFPCASTYAASKAAVLAFTDCLHLELEGTGVSTLCLITPGIKTDMFDDIDVKYSKNLEVPTEHISAEEYAEKIKKCILKDEEYYSPTGTTGIGLSLARNLPSLFKKAVRQKFKR